MSILDKASLIQIPSGYKSTKLYSLRPSNGTGDFTFARSSSATRVNAEGLIETAQVVSTTELVTNGNFATDSNWTKGTGWTISGGKANVASGSDGSALSQDISKVGVVNRVTFTISNYTGSGFVRLRTGNSSQVQDFSANGTYSFEVIPTTTTFSFARYMNGSLSIDNVSVKEVFQNDVPRLDYSGGASCASLLLEPQRTNLITYSEDFSHSSYIRNQTTATTGFISPDGNLNAYKLLEDNTNNIHRIYQTATVTGSPNTTISVYVKYLGRKNVLMRIADSTVGRWYDIENGVLGGTYQGTPDDSSIEYVSDGWYRISITHTVSNQCRLELWVSDTESTSAYQGDTTKGVYLFGAQLEVGSYPTSYIPTNGSTATRTADVCNNAGTSATFNDSEGVLFAEIAALADDLTTRFISISNGSDSNRVYLGYNTATNKIQGTVFSGGALSCGFNASSSDVTLFSKIAIKYKQNDFALWINGLEVDTDTSGSTPSNLNTLRFDASQVTTDFYGKCKQLMVFNEALSDEELSDLTGQVNLSFNNLATFYNYTIL
jgi:hypothetical protein